MKAYLYIVGTSFKKGIAYRADNILGIIRRFILLFIQICIWKAVLGTEGNTNVNNTYIDFNSMAVYVTISAALSMVINNGVIWQLNQKIKTGEISADLIKPLNLMGTIMANNIGESIRGLVLEFSPCILIVIITYGFSIPSFPYFILFIVTVINAYILYFLINYIVGIAGFWYYEIFHLQRLLSDVMRLLSGSLIPAWFFPDILNKINVFLPFRLIYYFPICVYLESISMIQIVYLFVQQILWNIIIFILCKFLWSKAKYKMTIQGG